jgi:hypothetical protein
MELSILFSGWADSFDTRRLKAESPRYFQEYSLLLSPARWCGLMGTAALVPEQIMREKLFPHALVDLHFPPSLVETSYWVNVRRNVLER